MKKRRKIRQLVWLLACLLGAWNVSGQDFVPKREFRAAWIATLSGIDWPSRAGLSVEQQQREYIRILDTLVACGMNAVIVQVRPKADAFYASKTEPWSQFLTGTRDGDPGYDPLAFMLEEAHRRGLELHVWLNPFRVTTGEDLSVLSPPQRGAAASGMAGAVRGSVVSGPRTVRGAELSLVRSGGDRPWV